MSGRVIVALRLVLIVMVIGLLAAQFWYFPTLAAQLAQIYPELSWLRWPMLAAVVAVILGVQAALVAVWALLAMVVDDSVFSERAFRFVDVIILAAVVDTVLVAAVNAYLSFGLRANPAGLMLGLTGLTIGGTGLALLMVVMKGLLRKASIMRAELSEVI